MILTRYRADAPPDWANDPIEQEPMMIEARSHILHAGGGAFRVLRMTAAHGRCWWLRYIVERGESFCHRCGCTDEIGCVGGCGWVTAKHDLCSRCFERMLT